MYTRYFEKTSRFYKMFIRCFDNLVALEKRVPLDLVDLVGPVGPVGPVGKPVGSRSAT